MTYTAYDIAKDPRWTYMTIPEIDCLHRLAALVPKDPQAIMINIGAGIGASGLALREGNATAHLISIDIAWEASTGCLLAERGAFEKAGREPPEQIQSESIPAGKNWKRGKVDLVFIDGNHYEEFVRGDIEAWLPHIRKGGILAFHDYDVPCPPWPIPWEDIRRAVDALVMPYYKVIEKVERIIAFRV